MRERGNRRDVWGNLVGKGIKSREKDRKIKPKDAIMAIAIGDTPDKKQKSI